MVTCSFGMTLTPSGITSEQFKDLLARLARRVQLVLPVQMVPTVPMA